MARRTSNIKILYLDIETAPTLCYTWSLFPKYININDVVKPGYTMCWAAKWEGDRDVLFGSTKDKGMLQNIWELIDEADAVVHYNGTRFDMPTLHREFVLNGMPPPSHYHQIDLLKTVRKQFRFQSNKLDFVAQQLGLGAKTQHKGMALWYECMDGDIAAWQKMKRYNKQDVVLTQKLYKKLLPWIHNHPNVGMWVVDPRNPVCTNCGSQKVQERGSQYNSKTASYKRYKCTACHTPLRGRLSSKKTSPNVLVRTN
jgi:DNA polymerase elongation subunit (family B)